MQTTAMKPLAWLALALILALAWGLEAQAQTAPRGKAPAVQAAGDKLPAAVSSRLQKMRAELDRAERVLSGVAAQDYKVAQAGNHLKAAQTLWEEAQKGYSGQFSPEHPDVKAVLERMAGVQAKLGQGQEALGEAQAAKDKARSDKAAQEAVSEKWAARLKPFVTASTGKELLPPHDEASWQKMAPIWAELKPIWEEFKQAQFPGGKSPELESIERLLGTRVQNYQAVADKREKDQAAAAAKMGKAVFSSAPIDPANPQNLAASFKAGENIYGLLQFAKPMGEIWGKQATILVNVSLDGKALRAQTYNISDPGELKKNFLVFNVAPAPEKMNDYANPEIKAGKVGDLFLGPVFLSKELSQLAPGSHAVEVKVGYFGDTYAAGRFTIEGGDYSAYAALHGKLVAAAAGSVTLPKAQITNKALEEEMRGLLKNAGWPAVLRLNIVDKDWWQDRASGGDSPIVSRRMDAAALAQAPDGSHYYKIVTFQQPRLITGDWGKLEIIKTGAQHAIPKENIDK